MRALDGRLDDEVEFKFEAREPVTSDSADSPSKKQIAA